MVCQTGIKDWLRKGQQQGPSLGMELASEYFSVLWEIKIVLALDLLQSFIHFY